MRNSNCLQLLHIHINVVVVFSIETTYQNIYVKSNLSDEFILLLNILWQTQKIKPMG